MTEIGVGLLRSPDLWISAKKDKLLTKLFISQHSFEVEE